MNVDIFPYKNLRKLAISRGLKFAFLILLPLCGIIKLIFKLYILSQIFEKRKNRVNMYNAKISTFTLVALIYLTSYCNL